MPIYFWNDEGRERYHKAYFDRFDNVVSWRLDRTYANMMGFYYSRSIGCHT